MKTGHAIFAFAFQLLPAMCVAGAVAFNCPKHGPRDSRGIAKDRFGNTKCVECVAERERKEREEAERRRRAEEERRRMKEERARENARENARIQKETAEAIKSQVESQLAKLEKLFDDHRLPSCILNIVTCLQIDLNLLPSNINSSTAPIIASKLGKVEEMLPKLIALNEQLSTASTKNIEAEKDDFNDFVIYRTSHNTGCLVHDTKVAVECSIIKTKDNPASLSLNWEIYAESWYFIDTIQLFGQETEVRLNKFDDNAYRNVISYDKVVERCAATVSPNDIENLLKSQTIKCRIIGEHHVGDFLLTEQQKLAIKEMLLKYYELSGDAEVESKESTDEHSMQDIILQFEKLLSEKDAAVP